MHEHTYMALVCGTIFVSGIVLIFAESAKD